MLENLIEESALSSALNIAAHLTLAESQPISGQHEFRILGAADPTPATPRAQDSGEDLTAGATVRRGLLQLELSQAADRCFEMSVKLRSAGGLAGEDERLLKRLRKASVRTRLRSEQWLVSRRDDALAFETELRRRLSNAGMPTSTPQNGHAQNGVMVTRSESARPRPRRQSLPLPLLSVQDTDILKKLEDEKVDWESLLTVSAQTRELTLSEVTMDPLVLQEFIYRNELLQLEGTMSAKEATRSALGREPLTSEVRRTQRLWQIKRNSVNPPRVDRRRTRSTVPFVMVPLTEALTLKYYHGRRRASHAQIAALVNQEIEKHQVRATADGFEPTLPRVTKASVARYLKRLPESTRMVREHDIKHWWKQDRLVDKRLEALYANHIWEIDHTPLDINCVLSAEAPDVIVRPHLTACVDVYSGMPMAVFVSSKNPDAFTTSLALSRGIEPRTIGDVEVGGLPTVLRPDHGADFMASHVAKIAAALPITLEYAAPNKPDEKPRVERFMRTVNQSLAKYPGHRGAEGMSDGSASRQAPRLLTMQAVIAAVNEFALEYAQRRRADTKQSPLERFASTVQYRLPANIEDLELLLLKTDKERVLTREGVRFKNTWYKGRGGTSAGHLPQDLTGRRVRIRYHPYTSDSIYVYDERTGQRLGEYVREDLFEGSAMAQNVAYLTPLRERTNAFAKAVRTEDLAAAESARAAELQTLVKQREEADEKAGVRTRTRAETRDANRDGKSEEKRREMMRDLLD